jgi:hypothetical protein
MPKNNTFYVQSNVIINTASGEVIPAITLTQIKDVATGYPESEAIKYLHFIESRRKYFNPNMIFDIVPAGDEEPSEKLIRGVIRDGK